MNPTTFNEATRTLYKDWDKIKWFFFEQNRNYSWDQRQIQNATLKS